MSKVIVTGLGRIRGITLDSTSGRMYITEWGNSSRIIQCNIDGQSCVTLVTIAEGHPNDIIMDIRDMGIIIDPNGRTFKLKTLFWSDSKQDAITVRPLDVFAEQTSFPLVGFRNPHPYAMSLSDDYLYFTDLNSGLLHFVEMPDSRTHLSGTVRNISLGLGTLYGLAVVRRNRQVSEQTRCLVNNGGCSHVCLAAPGNGRSCLCPSDLQLSPDGASCTVDGSPPPTTTGQPTTHPLIIMANGPQANNNVAASQDNHDKLMLSLVLTSCISVSIVVIIGLVFCFYKTRKRQGQLISRLRRFARRNAHDDHVKLFDDDHAAQNPSFKHFDDTPGYYTLQHI